MSLLIPVSRVKGIDYPGVTDNGLYPPLTHDIGMSRILEKTEEANVILHPNMANHYRKTVDSLIMLLNKDDHRQEAADILRGLIERIVLTPQAGQ